MSDLTTIRSRHVNERKDLLPALILIVVGAALIFIFSKALLMDQDFIGSIYENGVPRALAGFFLLAFPYIYRWFASKQGNGILHLPTGAVPFHADTLPGYMLVVYGILMAFAIGGVSIFLIWLAGLVTGFFFTRTISALNIIFLLIAFYYLGSWIERRSGRSPYMIAMGIVFGYAILELLVTWLLNIDSSLQSLFGLAIFLVFSLVVALIRTWVGRR